MHQVIVNKTKKVNNVNLNSTLLNVFFDTKKIILANEELDLPNISKTYMLADIKKMNSLLVEFENNPELNSILIYDKDFEKLLDKFQKEFRTIKAGGGFVFNQNDELLVIFRRGKWDLPKGKSEKRETMQQTALREVEEETGINNLEITRSLPCTCHYFLDKGKRKLKISYWYEMLHHGDLTPTPQTEEEIMEARWIMKSEIPMVLNNTFESLKDLLHHYLPS